MYFPLSPCYFLGVGYNVVIVNVIICYHHYAGYLQYVPKTKPFCYGIQRCSILCSQYMVHIMLFLMIKVFYLYLGYYFPQCGCLLLCLEFVLFPGYCSGTVWMIM